MTAFHMVDEPRRVAALTTENVEICGAYQPEGQEYWVLFVSQLVSQSIGMQTPPHREHFWGLAGKTCAGMWVKMIAALYTHEYVTPPRQSFGDCSGSLADLGGFDA